VIVVADFRYGDRRCHCNKIETRVRDYGAQPAPSKFEEHSMSRLEEPYSPDQPPEDERAALFAIELYSGMDKADALKLMRHAQFVHTPMGTIDVVDKEVSTTRVYEFDQKGPVQNLRAIVTTRPDGTVSETDNPRTQSIDCVVRDTRGGVIGEGATGDGKHYDIFARNGKNTPVHLRLDGDHPKPILDWHGTQAGRHLIYWDGKGALMTQNYGRESTQIEAHDEKGNSAQLTFEPPDAF
jgi:hypothetical protein